MSGELQCYNKGCGKTFKEEENGDDVCCHHPGVPVFHDALKGWSCCKKRSTDFTDFLNMPGCTKGKHNPIKPPEPEKRETKPLAHGEVFEVKAPKPKLPTERPSDDAPYIDLRMTVTGSLKSALARLELQETSTPNSNGNDEALDTVAIGTKCKHGGCEVEYVGPESDVSDCQHHPGIPIFHEGYKFWTCCLRRTSDWNEFIRQEGCKKGDHLWHDEDGDNTLTCRFDWHQTGSQVVISIYTKCVIAEESYVQANGTNVSVSLTFEGGKKRYVNSWKLGGVIDASKSSVELLGTKTEIKLRKIDGISWKSLQYKDQKKM